LEIHLVEGALATLGGQFRRREPVFGLAESREEERGVGGDLRVLEFRLLAEK